jgi:hypothetical protein
METVLFFFITFGCIVTGIICIGDILFASRKYRGQQNDHFDGARFYNIGWTKKESLKLEKREDGRGNMFTAFLEWMIKRKRGKWEVRSSIATVPDRSVYS